MALFERFIWGQPNERPLSWGDGIVLGGLAALGALGVWLAQSAPTLIHGPAISLSPRALPWYAVLSTTRMLVAYVLSLIFTLIYGYVAAYNRRAEQVLLPMLDVLQSVPILSFLPVVLLSLSAVLPQRVAIELAAVVLIFTSQAWNMTFAWYQSLTTIPEELREVGKTFRFNTWMRFKVLELPFGMISLIWNSMMSLAGGWFFLMAAEIFTVGNRDFRLPGLGSYLQEAANRGNIHAILLGVAVLVLVIVLLDQFIWRPLLAWSEYYRLEMVERDNPPTSWWYDSLLSARGVRWVLYHVATPLAERVDAWFIQRRPAVAGMREKGEGRSWVLSLFTLLMAGLLLLGIIRAVALLLSLPVHAWGHLALGLLATLLRVAIALVIALAWTIPAGVAIGTNQRLANWLQPIVQITASVPATALFPILLLLMLHLPGGLNLAAILLMLLGTQWYLLFNVIAGASAIPQDLIFTAALLRMSRWQRWRTLILPALFPYVVTGAITASGGAWNASIVAEYTKFGGQTYYTLGLGADIALATANGNFALLLAATLCMVFAVVVINRVLWRRMYALAEQRYRME